MLVTTFSYTIIMYNIACDCVCNMQYSWPTSGKSCGYM